MSEENKIVELKEEELKKVTGGLGNQTNFSSSYIGRWFSCSGIGEFVFRVRQARDAEYPPESEPYYPAAILDRFWHNGSEVWYFGTVTQTTASYKEITAPTTIHEDKMYVTKPF